MSVGSVYSFTSWITTCRL